MLTHNEVKELFDYDQNGSLIWRTGREDGYKTHRQAGVIAGILAGPYLKVSINSVKYSIHRLIWMWHHGYWPPYIDHINGDTYDNRIENLRECTPTQNAGNASRGPMRGIEKHGRKYRVRICTNYGKIELGSYETLDEALAARADGHREYFGEFTRD